MRHACRAIWLLAAVVVGATAAAVAGDATGIPVGDTQDVTAMGLGVGGLSLGAGLAALARALGQMAATGVRHRHIIQIDQKSRAVLRAVVRAGVVDDDEQIDPDDVDLEDEPTNGLRRRPR